MKTSLLMIAAVLSLQLLAPPASAQLSIDINSFGIPNIAFRALGFFGKWKDTDNAEGKKSEGNSPTFSGTTSWMFLDTGYAFSEDDEIVYQYALSDDGKSNSWEVFAEGYSSFQPTIVPSVYLYSLSGETRLYVNFADEVVDTQLCSTFYSFSVTTQTLFGIFEICDLDEGPFLGMLDVNAEEIVEIATIPNVDLEDMVEISAEGNGGCYAVDSSGNAYLYDADSDSWTQILQTPSDDKKEQEPLYVIGIASNTLDASVWLLTDPSAESGSDDEESKKNQVYLYNPTDDSTVKYSTAKQAKKLEATYILAASISDSEGNVLSFDIVVLFFISVGGIINGIVSNKFGEILEGLV